MTTYTLGISAFYHDSAAAIARDGEIIAAAQEERFSRFKNDPRFPHESINYVLSEAFIEPSQLSAVIFYDNPCMTFDRVLKSVLSVAPAGKSQWQHAAKSQLGIKFHAAEYVRRFLKSDVPVHFTRHHLSHAASAFYPSPFESAAILTMDGVGEWATTSISVGRGSDIKTLKEVLYPHSLGLLYSAFTSFCGFKVNSGEYKLMGLAPYGRPRFADRIREHLISIKPDGSFRLNTAYFGFLDGDHVTNERFHQLFEGPPRTPESPITRREMDLAASVQAVTEDAVLALARHAREITGEERLCLAGGVALNCVANGRLMREKVFEDIWIQPAAGDAGGALGAALLGAFHIAGAHRPPPDGVRDSQRGSYLGPAFNGEQVRAALDRTAAVYEEINDLETRSRFIANALADGKIVGFFSGRMEYGPRALGARSILGDPRRAETQVQMNLKIKYRESFRPFAPSVLESDVSEYFEIDRASPYMLLVAPVRQARRREMDTTTFDAGDDDLLPLVRQVRSDIPAVTHFDYTARIQTVGPEEHPAYHAVLEAFKERTGCSVLVNTSFNVRGEPIVCTPQDAYECFMNTEIDILVMESVVVCKDAQLNRKVDESWRSRFELD